MGDLERESEVTPSPSDVRWPGAVVEVGGGTVRVTVRVRPGASRAQVGGELDGALRVSVTARAVDGQATASALGALADAFGVRARAVALVSGPRSRTKIVEIVGDEHELTARLQALLRSG
jgi:uncharacterized protein (TIGR00251 family)